MRLLILLVALLFAESVVNAGVLQVEEQFLGSGKRYVNLTATNI